MPSDISKYDAGWMGLISPNNSAVLAGLPGCAAAQHPAVRVAHRNTSRSDMRPPALLLAEQTIPERTVRGAFSGSLLQCPQEHLPNAGHGMRGGIGRSVLLSAFS